MNPQSPNFFSSRNYTPAPRDFSSSTNVQGGGSFSQKLKNLSKNTKILIIVAIAAVILISLFAIIGNTTSKKNSANLDEFYDTLHEFKLEYSIFLGMYESYIGFEPSFEIDDGEFFPISKIAMDEFMNQKETVYELSHKIDNFNEDTNSELSDNQRTKIKDLKEKLRGEITEMASNAEVFFDFYIAFYKPIFEQLESDRSQSTCSTSEEMQKLLNADDKNISEAATLSKEVYCNFITSATNRIDSEQFDNLCATNHDKNFSSFSLIKNKMKKLDESSLSTDDLIDDIYEDM